MHPSTNCVFCKIIRQEIPAHIAYEDSDSLALMDIQPGTIGHTLVLPKLHVQDILEASPSVLQTTIQSVQIVAQAMKQAWSLPGVNIFQSNGTAAFQSVFHLHFHVIPRRENDSITLPWHPQASDPKELSLQAEQIRKAVAILRPLPFL